MTFASLLVRSLILLTCGAAAVTVSYFFIDRQVAWFVHDHKINHHGFLEWLTFPPIWLENAAVPLLALLAVRRAWGPFTRPERVALGCALNMVVTVAFKNQLKFVFGRYWPDTWVENNPSLIRTGAYGFHPFHDGIIYGDFPSGHTARIVAVVSVLWVAYPRAWPLWVVAAGLVMVGLVGMNYHFVGDVIAGAMLGTVTGMYTARFMGLDDPRDSTPTLAASARKP